MMNDRATGAVSDTTVTETDGEKQPPKALRLPQNTLWFGYNVKEYRSTDTDENVDAVS
jgi:hypothetical protein